MLLFIVLLIDHDLVVAGIGTGFAPAAESPIDMTPAVL